MGSSGASRSGGGIPTTRKVDSGTGLSGGGDLSADRTLTVTYGTTAGTAAQGNDSRITGAEQTSNKGAVSGYCGLDAGQKVAIANLPTGTSSTTVAIGDDSRLSDPRTPTAHAASHKTGQSDALTAADIGAAAAIGAGLPITGGPTATKGAGGTPADYLHAHPRERWVPADHGLLTWTVDPALPGSNTVPTSGVLNLMRVHLSTAASVTNVILYLVNAGTGLTSGQNFAGLWTAAGVLVGITADQTSAWGTIAGGSNTKTTALTSGPFNCAAGDYYIGFWCNGSGNPQFLRSGATTAVNVGLSAPNFRYATADTGLTTSGTAPNPFGTQTALLSAYWAALS